MKNIIIFLYTDSIEKESRKNMTDKIITQKGLEELKAELKPEANCVIIIIRIPTDSLGAKISLQFLVQCQ